LDTLNRSREHLLGLINEVLDVPKIEAGHVSVESTPFDLRVLVHETVEMIRPRANLKAIELSVSVSASVPAFARSDAGKLRRVLVNLIDNAVKFAEEGAVSILVDAKPIDGSRYLLLVLEVRDTGVGIAPEDQARIFVPLVRLANTAGQRGCGLGLSIIRHFVQMMAGTIRVDSAPGKGSLFHIEVPVENVEEPRR
jgi:signal transduction histidine kinase